MLFQSSAIKLGGQHIPLISRQQPLRLCKVYLETVLKKGTYHFSNTGDPISWAQFARAIFAAAGKSVSVTSIPAKEYPTPAARPAYSVMDTTKFEREFAHAIPDWKDGLARARATD